MIMLNIYHISRLESHARYRPLVLKEIMSSAHERRY